MRDVSAKSNTLRTARARATLRVAESTVGALRTGNVPKADPIVVAKVAGIQAAKNISAIIPYCHQVPLDFVNVVVSLEIGSLVVESLVKAIWKTGVEMEALVAASTAALTLYDMLKPIDDTMKIESIELVEKTGGKSSIKETGNGLTATVLVLSDSVSRGEKEDVSGRVLAEKLGGWGFEVRGLRALPDDCEEIVQELKRLADVEKVNLIATTGGTGTGPRDVTPEATLSVIERRLEGIEQTIRNFGQDRTPMAMLSRGVVGLRRNTVIINLPGSRSGVVDGMDAIFPALLHVFRMMKGAGH
jgi:cyclic pyranopterin phosphate synthase